MPIWGVDSVTSATSERVWEAGHGQETLFEFVARKLGEPPYFWGRYLRRSGSSMLTESERDYIHSQRSPSGETVRILPIYNDWIALDRRHAQQDLRAIRRQPNASALAYQYGGDDCRSALEIARRLIPETERSGVRIYYDLEGWDFPPEWLRGWWDVMRSSEFKGIGGLYGRGVERARGASRSVRIQDVDPADLHVIPVVAGVILSRPRWISNSTAGYLSHWRKAARQHLFLKSVFGVIRQEAIAAGDRVSNRNFGDWVRQRPMCSFGNTNSPASNVRSEKVKTLIRCGPRRSIWTWLLKRVMATCGKKQVLILI